MVPCHVIVSNTRSFSCYTLICWYYCNTKTFIILYVPCSNNKWFHVTWFSVMTLAPSFEHLLMVPVLFSQSDYWSPRWCFHLRRWSLPASFFLHPRSLICLRHSFTNLIGTRSDLALLFLGFCSSFFGGGRLSFWTRWPSASFIWLAQGRSFSSSISFPFHVQCMLQLSFLFRRCHIWE